MRRCAAYMFALLKAALNKKAEERTDGEKKLIQSFAGYIQQRRTYLAEQALAMYDSWKANDDPTGQDRPVEIARRIVLLRDGPIRLSRNAERIDGIRRSGRRDDRRPRRSQRVCENLEMISDAADAASDRWRINSNSLVNKINLNILRPNRPRD